MANRQNGKPLVIVLLLLLVLFLVGCESITRYETCDIQAYGVFPDDKNAPYAQALFETYFPQTIESFFEDVSYHYISVDGLDTYSFEIDLEFRIPDSAVYEEYLSQLKKQIKKTEPLIGNPDCQIGYFRAPACFVARSDPEQLQFADLQAVVYNTNQHSLYFVSLNDLDGGAAEVKDFRTFFDCFHVEPLDYSESLPEIYQPYD